jgi:Reverse transcriptase (RNA-dependent DNA polymerase)
MLERRIVIARLGQEEIAIKTTKGCHQGEVLSPLLWSLVIDNLLIELEQQGYEVLDFADDLVIIVRGKVDSLISDRLQFALNYATKWCKQIKQILARQPFLVKASPFGISRHICFFYEVSLSDQCS